MPRGNQKNKHVFEGKKVNIYTTVRTQIDYQDYC